MPYSRAHRAAWNVATLLKTDEMMAHPQIALSLTEMPYKYLLGCNTNVPA